MSVAVGANSPPIAERSPEKKPVPPTAKVPEGDVVATPRFPAAVMTVVKGALEVYTPGSAAGCAPGGQGVSGLGVVIGGPSSPGTCLSEGEVTTNDVAVTVRGECLRTCTVGDWCEDETRGEAAIGCSELVTEVCV